MDEEAAFEKFSKWYEECIEAGIEPEKIIERMGGMILITDETVIERLREMGFLPE